MKQNFPEIEALLLDYAEGRLSGGKLKFVEDFLKENPEYAEILDGLDSFSLKNSEAESIKFDAKSSLKHTSEFDFSDVPYFDRLCVCCLEGVATSDEQIEKQRIVYENPELKKDALLYGKAKLQADESVVFPKKESLKRRILIPWFKIAAAAAVLGLVLTFSLKDTENFEISPVSTASFQVAGRKTVETQTVENEPVKTPKQQNIVSCSRLVVEDEAIVEEDFQESETEPLLSPDFSKMRILETEFPDLNSEFKNFAAVDDGFDAEEFESQTIRADFLGSKLYRLKRRFRVELFRGKDGSFESLTIVTPDKTYYLTKRDKYSR